MGRSNSIETVQSIFYLCATSLYLIAFFVDMEIYHSDRMYQLTGLDFHRNFGGRLKFLTYIDMVIG